MSPLLFLAAALAGGVGAVLRYLVDLGVARLAGRRFPWGILVVNLTGSFALGLVTTALPEAASKSIQWCFRCARGLLEAIFTVGTKVEKGVPRPVVNSTSWHPAAPRAVEEIRSLPGPSSTESPGFLSRPP